MRPGGWAVSVNQRFTVEVPFIPTIEAMLDGAQSIGFSLRDALTSISSYKEAMPYLSNPRNEHSSLYLNSPVYLIVSGANPGEGTILTRKRMVQMSPAVGVIGRSILIMALGGD
eukprot:TRINITY_DN360_c0_g1_i1.p1 TRINITY_DN360_c0_g1~~TRINITY_DN360_c0_g1_i1.p1  ORF type:complete len:114 (-),score=9.50 TRINITY_DN360_c0_g1_i1:91-432(-)